MCPQKKTVFFLEIVKLGREFPEFWEAHLKNLEELKSVCGSHVCCFESKTGIGFGKKNGSFKLPGCKTKKTGATSKNPGIFSNKTLPNNKTKQRQLLVTCFQTAPNPKIA